jgi:hypothetical protein
MNNEYKKLINQFPQPGEPVYTMKNHISVEKRIFDKMIYSEAGLHTYDEYGCYIGEYLIDTFKEQIQAETELQKYQN